MAPTWTVTPAPLPPPGQPQAPPIVVAQVVAPDPEPGDAWGPAVWVKVYTTEVEHDVQLEDLVGNNADVKQALQNTEIEWQLLQRDPGNPNSGVIENGGGKEVGANAASVLRRYEFYHYTGDYSSEGEATPAIGDGTPADGEIGSYMGAQNAALNLNPVAAAPEPASWALMMMAVGGIGAALRTRRRGVAIDA